MASTKNMNAIIEDISRQVNTLYEPIPKEYKNINIDNHVFQKQVQEMKELEDLITYLEDLINE
jgi:hypothetical protein